MVVKPKDHLESKDDYRIFLSKPEQLFLHDKGYRFGKVIGRGAFSSVVKVKYRKNKKGTQLACKVIQLVSPMSDIAKKFVPREMDILTKVNHPHIIKTHCIIHIGNRLFVFMRYAENGDLASYLVANGVLSEFQAKIWFRQIAQAVHYLHKMQITHRDIKCENILLTANMNAKLGDFGLARFMTSETPELPNQSSTFCGSIYSTPPEVMQGVPYNPFLADVWSLGIMLFVMLNRISPFDSRNARELVDRQMKKDIKYKKEVQMRLSFKVKYLISKMLEPTVPKRYNMSQVITSDWLADIDNLKIPQYVRSLPSEEVKTTSLVPQFELIFHHANQKTPRDPSTLKKVTTFQIRRGGQFDLFGNNSSENHEDKFQAIKSDRRKRRK